MPDDVQTGLQAGVPDAVGRIDSWLGGRLCGEFLSWQWPVALVSMAIATNVADRYFIFRYGAIWFGGQDACFAQWGEGRG